MSAPHHSRPGGRGGRPWEGRVRRGDLRGLLLAGLVEGAAHGYELMSRLQARSAGRWRPSPGSVYPQLQQLADEGLVRAHDDGGRTVYTLTARGRTQADGAALDALADDGDEGRHSALRDEVRQLHLAAKQVGLAGDADQVETAVGIVRAARQSLYRILADK